MNLELVVINGKQKGTRFPVQGAVTRIGRDGDCEIQLHDLSVSRRHARLIRKDGQVLLEDMGSRNGTFVSGQLIDAPHAIAPHDIVQVGLNLRFSVEAVDMQRKVTAELPQPPITNDEDPSNTTTGQQTPRPALNPDDARRTSGELKAVPIYEATVPVPGAGPALYTLKISGGKQSGETYPLSAGQHPIGRAPDNTIVLHNPDISNHHAVIHVNAEGLWLQDLGSRNGTYINNRAVHGPTWLNPGDVVQFGATLVGRIVVGIPASE